MVKIERCIYNENELNMCVGSQRKNIYVTIVWTHYMFILLKTNKKQKTKTIYCSNISSSRKSNMTVGTLQQHWKWKKKPGTFHCMNAK
jgi:hypothetical protein